MLQQKNVQGKTGNKRFREEGREQQQNEIKQEEEIEHFKFHCNKVVFPSALLKKKKRRSETRMGQDYGWENFALE